MSGIDIDWNLAAPVNVGGALMQGFERGQALRRESDARGALAAFAANPADPHARANAFTLAPQQANSIETANRENADWQRGQRFRAAAGTWLGGSRDNSFMPAPSALANVQRQPIPDTYNSATPSIASPMPMASPGGPQGMPQAGPQGMPEGAPQGQFAAPPSGAPGMPQPSPAGPAGAQPSGAPAGAPQAAGGLDDLADEIKAHVDSQRAAFAEMYKADPMAATEIVGKQYQQFKMRLELTDSAVGRAIQRLANVGNEQQYQAVLGQLYGELTPMGVDIRSEVPPNYPGPDGIRSLVMSGMHLRDQLAATDRYARLQWDVQDDEIDNARSDRNVDSQVEDRTDRRAITVRGQNLTDARGRRGQDMSDARGRRGQDMTDTRDRRGQDMTDSRIRSGFGGGRGGNIGKFNLPQNTPGASAALPVIVTTPDQARLLPKGTYFQTPDGRTKIR